MSIKDLKEKFEAKKAIKQTKEIVFLDEKVLMKQIGAYSMEEYREYEGSDNPQIKRLYRAKLLQLCLHDIESGQRIYDDNEVTQIVGQNPAEIDRVYFECLRFNGYGSGQADILKNLLMTLGVDGLRELRGIIDAQLQSSCSDTPPGNSSSST